jgi:hypothetical protein
MCGAIGGSWRRWAGPAGAATLLVAGAALLLTAPAGFPVRFLPAAVLWVLVGVALEVLVLFVFWPRWAGRVPGRAWARPGEVGTASRAALASRVAQALEAQRAYAHAVIAFHRLREAAFGGQGEYDPEQMDRAVYAMRAAHAQMERIYGPVGVAGRWPIPVGAPLVVLEEVERQCIRALARLRQDGAAALGQAAWVGAAAGSRAYGGSLPAGRRPVEPAPAALDALAVYRRAWSHPPVDAAGPRQRLPAPAAPAPPQDAPTSNAAPAAPNARLRFARWLVQSGRLSDWTVDGEPPSGSPGLKKSLSLR